MKPYRNTARMAHVEHIFVGIPQVLTYFAKKAAQWLA
jgi:hypothetical protein